MEYPDFNRGVDFTLVPLSKLIESLCHKNIYLVCCCITFIAIIEKNVRNGVHDHFRPLNTLLTQESDKVVICSTERPRKKKRYTRHRAVSTSRTSQRPSNGAISTTKSITASHPTSEVCFSGLSSFLLYSCERFKIFKLSQYLSLFL